MPKPEINHCGTMLAPPALFTIYQKRWKVEGYHKALKQPDRVRCLSKIQNR